jgi:hypothetical protein
VFALGRGDLLAVLPEGTFDRTPATPRSPAQEAAPGGGSDVWLPALLALLVLPLVLLPAVKVARRRLRYRSNDPRRSAAAARAELVDILRDQGASVSQDAGSDALRVAVERHLGVPGAPFVAAHARARYGPPDAATDAASDTRHELRSLKRLARERLSQSRRARGALSPRSLRRA